VLGLLAIVLSLVALGYALRLREIRSDGWSAWQRFHHELASAERDAMNRIAMASGKRSGPRPPWE